jgi:hypothetical protein
MSESNLYNMSLAQLKQQAEILGIAIKGNPSADTLRARIKQAVEIEPSAEEKERLTAKAEENPIRKKDWVQIIIAEDEKDMQPVFVGVNGKSYRIRRGESVAVPPEVVNVLRDAQQVVTNTTTGAQKRVPTYPFSIER